MTGRAPAAGQITAGLAGAPRTGLQLRRTEPRRCGFPRGPGACGPLADEPARSSRSVSIGVMERKSGSSNRQCTQARAAAGTDQLKAPTPRRRNKRAIAPPWGRAPRFAQEIAPEVDHARGRLVVLGGDRRPAPSSRTAARERAVAVREKTAGPARPPRTRATAPTRPRGRGQGLTVASSGLAAAR